MEDLKERISYFLGNNELTNDDLDELKDILINANEVYSNSGEDTGLTDTEYDILVSLYEDKSGKSLPIGAKVNSKDKVSARYLTLRGTLSKVYALTDDDILLNKSQKTIDDWMTKVKNIYKEKTGRNIDVSKLPVMVVPKFDGVSVVCEFTKEGKLIRAITRGDTINNESKDVTNVVKYVFNEGPFKSALSEYAVKCEAMTLNSDLDEVNSILHKDYKNTRALASGILNTDDIDPNIAKYLHLIQLRYSYLDNGVESVQYMSADMYDNYFASDLSKEGLSDIRSWALKHSNIYPGYRCDGAVICIMDDDVRKVLGRSGDKQNYEVAYKFTCEYGISTVKDIEFSVGNLGTITPVVIFKKIKLKGNDVKRATISYSDFLRYRLAKGDEIKVAYDIIPYVTVDNYTFRSGNKRILQPSLCPECGSTLLISESGRRLYCDNPKCICRIKGKILNYTTKMGIENISFETITDLYEAGCLKSIEDLYKLESRAKKIAKIPGYGVLSVSKILKSIDNNKVVTPSKFLGSIGIEGISIRKFHDILQYISYDELLEYGFNKEVKALVGFPGYKEKTSTKIIEGIYENRKLIENLENCLTILDEPQDNASSYSVTFTKIRDDDLEEWIKQNNGTINNSSVTKDTSLVIVPNMMVSSSKTDKAIKLNIPIVDIENAKDYIRRNFLNDR